MRLAEAGSQGYLAFVDDDETVAPDWLVELVAVARDTGAAFVQGPLTMTVENSEDSWWLESGFFRQKSFADRALRHESWTNNVLIDLAFIIGHGCRFDAALQFDGGGDTLFFQDVVAAGGEGRFAAKAIVYEVQSPKRLTWKWALLRHYRYGITRANTSLLRRSRLRSLGYCGLRGSAMLVLGILSMPRGFLLGRRGFADGLALIARGCGVILGFFGGKRREYSR